MTMNARKSQEMLRLAKRVKRMEKYSGLPLKSIKRGVKRMYKATPRTEREAFTV